MQLAKMSFDEILDLTTDVFLFYNIHTKSATVLLRRVVLFSPP